METVTIVVICSVVFGTVTALSAFVRQLMLSRDKNLNDIAEQRALLQETNVLEKLRTQMESNKRFDSHYQVLGANKDAIQYIDQKIDDILNKKLALIQRYADTITKESSEIIDRGQSIERKAACDRLKIEIDSEIQYYDSELQQSQIRRASIWDARQELQGYLISHEQSRNENLDKLYQGHTVLLEKIYVRHDQSTEHVAIHTIDAGTQSFKEMVMGPIHFLMQYFKLSEGISSDRGKDEKLLREKLKATEKELNDETHDTHEQADSDDFILNHVTP